jgi:probable AcnD-accessory protein PrpF
LDFPEISRDGLCATFMRGGTSKGVFFVREQLPEALREPSAARDDVFLRLLGSPDPYGSQMDGMGSGSSSTSKVVIVGRSARPGHDVDYLFGAVAIGEPLIDWSGNCGNLSAAVGPFAITEGLVQASVDGVATVRIWQENLGQTLVARVRMRAGVVQEHGDCTIDGVAFPGAPIDIEFFEPEGTDAAEVLPLLPTGRVVDRLTLPDGQSVLASLVNAGNPTAFVRASDLGLAGTELPQALNGDAELLARMERVRACAAVAMGIAPDVETATTQRPATPKLCLVAPPASYVATSGRDVAASDLHLTARILSMGKFHHAMTGTGAVAIAAAASVEGSLVQQLLTVPAGSHPVVFGHPAGKASAAARAVRTRDGSWRIECVTVTRTARRLMQGHVFVPPTFN